MDKWGKIEHMNRPVSESNNNHESIARYGVGVIFYAVILGAVVAVIAGYYEVSFRFLAKFWQEGNRMFDSLPQWLLFAIGPFLACPVLYWMLKQIPEKRQHNPADLITGIHIRSGHIDAKSSLLSALASVFSIGCGFSVGYYAPTVQLGGGVGYLLHKLKWLRPAYRYISVGAGAAAAIAAIFHAPLGAVVFVHEVLLRFFSIRAFAPITIAAVTAYIVSSKWFDKAIFFDLPQHHHFSTSTYLIAALGGVVAAFIGISQIRTIMYLQGYVAAKKIGIAYRLVIAAALTAVIISVVPQVAGSSLQAMSKVLGGQSYTLVFLLVIFVAKGAATIIAFGFGIPGGIFGATIFIGAALGGLLSEVTQLLYPTLGFSHEIIIITTMAAMISAVIGAPIAMILIVIEITGDFQIVSIVMLAVVMANITAYRFMGTTSFFDLQLKSRGLDLEHGRDRLYSENQTISSLISDDYLSLPQSMLLPDARRLLLDAQKSSAFVVDEHNNLLGQVRLVDIEFYHREAKPQEHESASLKTVTYTGSKSIYPATSIWQAMEIISQTNSNFAAVVDGENNPKLLGVVYHNQLVSRYLSFLRQLRDEENAGR